VTRKRLVSAAALAAAVLVPHLSSAQPTPVPEPEEVPPPPPPAVDEEKIRAIVQEELAKQPPPAPPPVSETVVGKPAEEVEPEEEDYLTGGDGFVDVRLNFTLTNENLLAKPGETIPSVPGWRFGRPNSLGTLFFDNYDTRFSGYETLSHAVLYRNYRKDHLESEAGFVLRINELSEKNIALSDAGSYVLVSWWQDPTRTDPTRVTLTAFPVSADRFRLGYSYRLSWGGNEDTRNTSPGVKLQYDTGRAYAFVGAKSSLLLNRLTGEQEARLSALAGAGVDVTPAVRVELNGGLFDRGNNELQDVLAEKVQLFGGSLQVAVHDGMPVTSSLDYKLYKYDPERIGRAYQKAKYPGGLSWLVMAEGTILGQTLKDPEKTGSTKIQWGAAGDVNVRAMLDRTRIRVDLQYRDLAFILHSVPSLPTFSDFPEAYDIKPNFFAAVGADQNFEDRLTLGAVLGLELPATLTSPTGIPGDNTMTGESTAVIRNNGQQTLITILPAGEKVAPQLAAKFTSQLDFGEIYAAILDLYYSYDPNQTRLTRDDPDETFKYEFGEFNQLGVNVTLQAKF